ncbi:hypothetical protein BC332_27909 [Capsicum chinense]|nr:hypothetical protein BC332_27909 [Capsicum chinense]
MDKFGPSSIFLYGMILGSLFNKEVTPTVVIVLAIVLREETRFGTQPAMESMPLLSVSLLVGKSTIVASIENTKRSVNVMNAKTLVMSQPIVLRRKNIMIIAKLLAIIFRIFVIGQINHELLILPNKCPYIIWFLPCRSGKQIKDSTAAALPKAISTNGNTLPASGIGSAGYLSNVLYVPNLKANMISAGQLVDQNCVVKFSPNGCVSRNFKTGMIMATGHRFCIMLLLESVHCHLHHCFLSVSVVGVTLSNKFLTLWHNRMGHPHFSRLHHMLKSCTNYAGSSVQITPVQSDKLLFPSSSSTYEDPFDLVDSDVWVPSPILSRMEYKYFV